MTYGEAGGMACEPLKAVFKKPLLGATGRSLNVVLIRVDIIFVVGPLAPLALLNHSHLTGVALLDGAGVTDN
jgi:hypothetical protein